MRAAIPASPPACSALGILYNEGTGVARDPAKARTLFESACGEKGPEGCYQLALHWGDPASRFASYKIACDAEHADACTELAVHYERGKAVTPDLARSREIADKACRLGGKLGCSNFAIFLWLGKGGPKDLERAATLSRTA